MSDYTVAKRADALDYMAEYPGYGEMRSFTDALDCEQVAFTWRQMPEGTGGRGSYGHSHKTQEEVYFVTLGAVTFKIDDDEFVAEKGTAVRIAPGGVRSVHNDGPGEAELVICSKRVDDLEAEMGHHVDDFWPTG